MEGGESSQHGFYFFVEVLHVILLEKNILLGERRQPRFWMI